MNDRFPIKRNLPPAALTSMSEYFDRLAREFELRAEDATRLATRKAQI